LVIKARNLGNYEVKLLIIREFLKLKCEKLIVNEATRLNFTKKMSLRKINRYKHL